MARGFWSLESILDEVADAVGDWLESGHVEACCYFSFNKTVSELGWLPFQPEAIQVQAPVATSLGEAR
jgi:hypothetical protein